MNIYKTQNDDTNVTTRGQGRSSLFECILSYSALQTDAKSPSDSITTQKRVPKNTGTDRNGPKRTGTDRNGPERTETDMKNDRNGLEIYRNGLEIYRNGLEIDRNGL